ncbi:MAG: peptidoglycan DD-metalloendopeptidase family protein [Nitrosomonadales bacterium]|nr:peptidoglycan DD-metalloendopeptidase family protein [Nitrosomonadales bacterium]
MNLKKRLLLLLGACLIAGSGLSQAGTQQEELDKLRKQIKSMQQELEKTNESKSEAADALRESELAISGHHRKLVGLKQQQHEAVFAIQQLQAQAQEISANLEDQQVLLGKLLYQQYVGGRQEYLRLMFNNRDPNQVARELRYYEYITRNRAAWLNTLRANLARLNAVTEQTRKKSEEIARLQSEELSQKRDLEQEKRARQQVLDNIAQQLQQQRREMSRLQHNENRLSQLVEQLAKMLAQQPKSKPNARAMNNDKTPDNSFDGKPFEQLRGKLALPVKGTVSNQFGAQRPDSTMQWKGLFLHAAGGQSVKSVAAGRVVFADWLRGFGNLLIIDHGQGYMSLYGNNETLYKQVGDVLRGGDVIAAVGNSGGNETSGLYFELRHEGKPIDPMRWVAVR